jgi:pimeloyl-ACP methyl ester carboxylesterase
VRRGEAREEPSTMDMGPTDSRKHTEPIPLTLEGAGCRLRAYDYGNATAPLMVLVHGIQDFALALEPIAEAFRGEYRVVACDLRGHGDSEKPGVYTMGHYLADLHAVLHQLEGEGSSSAKPILVGHSLGALITTQYAGVFPEVPRAVVNIDGLGPPVAAGVLDVETKQYRTQEAIRGLLRAGGQGRPMVDLDDATSLFLRFHPRLDPERARRLVAQGCEKHPHGGVRWKWDPHVTTAALSSTPEIADERFGWVTCPVLLATAGEVDAFWMRRMGLDAGSLDYDRSEIERRAALFRNATLVEIPGAGHHIHYDAPDTLVRVMREFLGALR